MDMERDGCALAEWATRCGDASFARHPKGFNIFIAPEKIAASDEYADSDPYSMEQDMDNEFHRLRIALTVELAREAVAQVRGTAQILDLGCGQGHITEAVRQALGHAELTGLDHSVSAIEYAHDHFPKIEFEVGDACDSPYADEFFDLVLCNNVWEHVPDPLRLLAGVAPSIKPGGFFVMSTPSRYRLGNLARILRGKPVGFMSRHHVTEYSVGQVKEQFAHGGFCVVRVLSRPYPMKNPAARIARWVLNRLISLVGSHHQLESTVFYLAHKTVETGK